MKTTICRLLVLHAFCLTHAMAVPDDAALREILAKPDDTAFFAGFHAVLPTLDATNIAAFRERLAAGVDAGALPPAHAAQALELVDRTWARLAPRELLEAACACRREITDSAKRAALGTLLGQDLEAAVALYLRCPFDDGWATHCWLFSRLAKLDPARGVRLFVETSEGERIYPNSLETCFESWAAKDLAAAWAAACQLDNARWRQAAQRPVLARAATHAPAQVLPMLKSAPGGYDRLDDLLATVPAENAIAICREFDQPRLWLALATGKHFGPPAQSIPKQLAALPVARLEECLTAYFQRLAATGPADAIPPLLALIPAGPVQDAVRAKVAETQRVVTIDDATLEAILAAGAEAYDEKSSDDRDGKKLAAMFARFPERSWEWLRPLGPAHGYADNRCRDLAACWPIAKLATDAPQFLGGDRMERILGLWLAGCWMKADPEAAVPSLFSTQPARAAELRNRLPFHEMVWVKKWSREKVTACLDQITDPAARASAQAAATLYYLAALPPAKRLLELLALSPGPDLDQAALAFARASVRSDDFGQALIDQIVAMEAAHAALRDLILAQLPYEIVDAGRGSDSRVDLIPAILTAIPDPARRLAALRNCRNLPSSIASRLVGIVAEIPPGGWRDETLSSLVADIPTPDAVALAGATRSPLVQSRLLVHLSSQRLTADQCRACQKLHAALPAPWCDPQMAERWRTKVVMTDPAATLPDLLALPLWNPSWDAQLHELLCQRMDRDPRAALAIFATAFQPQHALLAARAFRSANPDFPTAFRYFRAHPLAPAAVLTHLFVAWAEESPAAACAATLLIESPTVRAEAQQACLQQWQRVDPQAAAKWLQGLPAATPPPPAPQSDRTTQQLETAVRTLAALDLAATTASVRQMPDGPAKSAALRALAEPAAAAARLQTGPARLALINDLLENRVPAPATIQQAQLDEATAKLLETWLLNGFGPERKK